MLFKKLTISFKKTSIKLLYFIALLQISSAGYTYQENQLLPQVDNGHLIFQAGGFRSVVGKKNVFHIDDSTITFLARNEGNNNANALIGLGFYVNTQNYGQCEFSFGVNPFYLAKVTVTGTISENNSPPSLAYEYDVTNLPVYFMLKAITHKFSESCPLSVDAGIGPNFMHVYRYNEYSLDGITIDTPTFYGKAVVTPSATLGVGLEFQDIIESASIGIGYRLFLFGKGKLYPNNTEILESLTTGEHYSNAIVVSIIF